MTAGMLTIDGSEGEGGGQIIRSALALSLVTGKAFAIKNVRARRKKPGLQPQHVTSVKAAQQVGSAHCQGAFTNSTSFTFEPGPVTPGSYVFNVGTAGSCMLVLQTVLPPLMIADKESEIVVSGGTHNPNAPPFDFIKTTFLPVISKIGPRIDVQLIRHGFYPAGGGKVTCTISPHSSFQAIEIKHRGEIKGKRARSMVARLPKHIAERELAVVRKKLPGWREHELQIDTTDDCASPGNFITIEYESDQLTELITSIGGRGITAEAVAEAAAEEAQRYVSSEAPVGEHLADQLLLPMALCGGGNFLTGPLTEHTRTNINIIKKFLDIDICVSVHPSHANLHEIRIKT